MNPIKTLKWWKLAFRDLRLWLIFYRVTRSNAKVLEEKHKLRVDWLGRVYGVINLPEEVLGAAPEIQQSYVLQQISKRGDAMNELRLSDIVYPEIQQIPGAGAYLIVLWPEFENLEFWTIIGRLSSTVIWALLISFGTRVIYSNWHDIIDFFSGLV